MIQSRLLQGANGRPSNKKPKSVGLSGNPTLGEMAALKKKTALDRSRKHDFISLSDQEVIEWNQKFSNIPAEQAFPDPIKGSDSSRNPTLGEMAATKKKTALEFRKSRGQKLTAITPSDQEEITKSDRKYSNIPAEQSDWPIEVIELIREAKSPTVELLAEIADLCGARMPEYRDAGVLSGFGMDKFVNLWISVHPGQKKAVIGALSTLRDIVTRMTGGQNPRLKATVGSNIGNINIVNSGQKKLPEERFGQVAVNRFVEAPSTSTSTPTFPISSNPTLGEVAKISAAKKNKQKIDFIPSNKSGTKEMLSPPAQDSFPIGQEEQILLLKSCGFETEFAGMISPQTFQQIHPHGSSLTDLQKFTQTTIGQESEFHTSGGHGHDSDMSNSADASRNASNMPSNSASAPAADVIAANSGTVLDQVKDLLERHGKIIPKDSTLGNVESNESAVENMEVNAENVEVENEERLLAGRAYLLF